MSLSATYLTLGTNKKLIFYMVGSSPECICTHKHLYWQSWLEGPFSKSPLAKRRVGGFIRGRQVLINQRGTWKQPLNSTTEGCRSQEGWIQSHSQLRDCTIAILPQNPILAAPSRTSTRKFQPSLFLESPAAKWHRGAEFKVGISIASPSLESF